MRRLALLVVVCCVLLAGAAGLRAQDDASKDKKIRRLLVLTGELETAVMLCKQSLDEQKGNPMLPPGYIKRFKQLANEQFFADLFAPIYAKHFDEEDIDKLLAFYETPVGKKLMKVRPAIQKEAGEAAQTAGMKLGMKVLEELQKDEEEDEAPAPKGQKKKADEDQAPKPKKKADEDDAPKPKKDDEPKAKEPLGRR